jgi:hypothetical protein
LLQANKGSKHDLKSWKGALQQILLSLFHVGYHLPCYSSTTTMVVLSIMKNYVKDVQNHYCNNELY